MKEIICPNCKKSFVVDEQGYADIVQQVRSAEFDAELHKRLSSEIQHINEINKAETEIRLNEAINKKNSEISELSDQIADLENKLSGSAKDKELAVMEAEKKADAHYGEEIRKISEKLVEKEQKVLELNGKLEAAEQNTALRITTAVTEKNAEIDRLRSEIKTKEAEDQLKLNEAVEKIRSELEKSKAAYEADIRAKEDLIVYYKDFKTKMSTKMVGESLEQYCKNQFDQLRMTGFRNAYFEKDNDARSGSKGDFIYREKDENGVELISIMFEMKNEMSETATKHKNEDFFKELDKDRTEKECEYAVLVSMLEADSDLYNIGIVDVSYRYPKMYVIRPQFFIPMITLLRNAALNSMQYRQELEMMKAQNIDITNFEKKLSDFKSNFSSSYIKACEKFDTAISEIDKSIDHLQKIKAALLSSENNLRIANNKTDEITIKKLTRGNPTMKKMFEELPPPDESEE